MTTAALRQLLYENGYPPQFEVDHHTYANVCQEIFNRARQDMECMNIVEIWLGSNGGIMFKNTELILRNGG